MNEPKFYRGDRVGNNAGSIEGVVVDGPTPSGAWLVCRFTYCDLMWCHGGDLELLLPLRPARATLDTAAGTRVEWLFCPPVPGGGAAEVLLAGTVVGLGYTSEACLSIRGDDGEGYLVQPGHARIAPR